MSILSEENDAARRPAAGRRSGFTDSQPSGSQGLAIPKSNETITSPRTDAGPPAPSRRQAGWGEGTTAAGQAGEAKRRAYEGTETIMVIPDLDDSQRDDVSTQIADAPASAMLRMPGFTELNAGMLQLPAAPDAEVDLSVLIGALAPHSQLNEGRGVWTFENLFSEVSGELQTEQETAEPASTNVVT